MNRRKLKNFIIELWSNLPVSAPGSFPWSQVERAARTARPARSWRRARRRRCSGLSTPPEAGTTWCPGTRRSHPRRWPGRRLWIWRWREKARPVWHWVRTSGPGTRPSGTGLSTTGATTGCPSSRPGARSVFPWPTSLLMNRDRISPAKYVCEKKTN